MLSSGAGESSNSLNDRTAVRIDAAIQAAMAIAGTSTEFDVPRPTGGFDAVNRGGGGGGSSGGGGRDDTSCKDLTIRPGSNSGGSGGSLASGGSEMSTKPSAVVVRGSEKATTEARLDAAIKAALVIHATDRSSSSSSSRFQGSYPGGRHGGSSLALTAPRGDGGGGGSGGGGMLTVYQPPAPPRIQQGRSSASRGSSSGGFYGGTSDGDGNAGGYLQLTDSRPAPGGARGGRSGIGIRAGVDMAVQALASARKAEAHQADAAAARLQKLKEQRVSRRRRQQEQGSGGERPHRQRESEAPVVALEQREDHPRRIADVSAREQARAEAETRTRAETFARERVSQDEQALVTAHRPPAFTREGPEAGAYDSRAVIGNNRSSAGGNAGVIPAVFGDRFLPEPSTDGGRRARVGARGSQGRPWDDGDGQNADSSGALAQWNW